MSKIGVVVPSNRPDELVRWKETWQPHLDEVGARLYVVEDQPETWDLIKKDLGKDAWIIPVRTDCIRSYGYLNAYRDGCEYIVTLDDDVRPLKNALAEHVKWLETYVEPDNWTRTLKNGPPTRGLPLVRKVVLSHGLWDGVPDVSASVQISGFPPFLASDKGNNQIIPRGTFYPMSGMNLAWHRDITPLMYFGLQGRDIRDPEKRWGLDRCGDIIAGVLSKLVIDTMPGAAVHSGEPYVDHRRASDPLVNLELEKAGEFVPYFFSYLNPGTYLNVAYQLYNRDYPSKSYCRSLGRAMEVWWRLCQKG